MHRQRPATALAGHSGHEYPPAPAPKIRRGLRQGRRRSGGRAARADYVTIWLGTFAKARNGFNPYWHGRMLDLVRERSMTAVYYAYIIAKLARRAIGAKDCDRGGVRQPSLCVDGAEFVRQNEPLILARTSSLRTRRRRARPRSARGVAHRARRYQYHAPTQRSGGLPQPAMVRLFGRMVGGSSAICRWQASRSTSRHGCATRRHGSSFLKGCAVDYLHERRAPPRTRRGCAHKPGNDATWAELRESRAAASSPTPATASRAPLGADPGRPRVGRRGQPPRAHPRRHRRHHAGQPVCRWERLLPRLRTSLPRARGCFRTAHGNRARTRRGRGNEADHF